MSSSRKPGRPDGLGVRPLVVALVVQVVVLAALIAWAAAGFPLP